jgi:AraC-like DNA-binding protein
LRSGWRRKELNLLVGCWTAGLDLANRYLADAETSISQVAWLLGYQEVSAFSKAFKRWTGTSPREARARRAH